LLEELSAHPITHVRSSEAEVAAGATLTELSRAMEELAGGEGITGLSDEARTASIESLRRLLEKLEGGR
jgi:hypothetical protein